jgi:hypothetical protein
MALMIVPARAQQPVDFGSSSLTNPPVARDACPTLAFKPSQTDPNYYVTVSVAGMVFDHTREYSLQLSSNAFGRYQVSSDILGIYHSKWSSTPPLVSGDVTRMTTELLGAGVYNIRIEHDNEDFTIQLDLTDGKWADGGTGFRNILVDPEGGDNDDEVRIWVSSDDPDDPDMIDCGSFGQDGISVKYWQLVRNDPNAQSYVRDRHNFSIDPNYTGPNGGGAPNSDEIPYGVADARLDVHALVKDNIVIPSGSTWRVTSDPDVINAPTVVETKVMFAGDKGLTVRDGGTFRTSHTHPYGVTDWFCYQNTDKGAWTGIAGETGATIYMHSARISSAVVGMKVEESSDVKLEVVEIDSSRDHGMHIINCSPDVDVSLISNTGGVASSARSSNVLIEGAQSHPTFSWTGITRAAFTFPQAGGISYGGHGIEIVDSDEAHFDSCTVRANDSCGYFIHNTVGPFINYTRIDSNKIGIHVEGGSNWTTLRYSRVFGNLYRGIYTSGTQADPARIRGWYHEDQSMDPASNPVDVDSIVVRKMFEGRNCIFDNYENIRSAGDSYLDFGREYLNNGGIAVTLGAVNSIFTPSSGIQVILNNSSFGYFRENWWDGLTAWNLNLIANGGSTLDYADESQTDSLGCIEFGKRAADPSGSYTSDLLRYRRTRGLMQTPEVRTEAGGTPAVRSVTMFLAEPYPNPFNPQTSIAVTLFERQDITLFVTDVLGRTVATLVNGHYDAGRYSLTFDAGSLPSGMYHVVLRNASSVQTRRLLLTK